MFKTSNFINIFISNMKHFRESMNNITELDNQFDKDFENFNKSFFLFMEISNGEKSNHLNNTLNIFTLLNIKKIWLVLN